MKLFTDEKMRKQIVIQSDVLYSFYHYAYHIRDIAEL